MKKTTSRAKLSATKRGLAYSLAAGAATLTATSEADAAINYSGLQNISIAQLGFQPLNLDGDSYNDIVLKNYIFGGGNYMGATVSFSPGQLVLSNASFPFYVSALSPGDLIDGTTVGPSFYGSMAYGAVNPNSEFNNATDAYLGLSFPTGPNTYFGWIRVDIDQASGTFLIKDWAYNDTPGAGILAGQIPEPASLGLLAAGSAGLLAMRRRKQAA